MFAHLHVRAETAGLEFHDQAGLRVGAELTVALGRLEQLDGLDRGQLVGGQVVGDRRPVLAALEVGAVAADAGDDGDTVGVGPDRDRVDGASVDLAQAVLDQLLEARPIGKPEVEVAQVGDRFLVAAGDEVEIVFHAGGEGVVDQVGEVLLEQGHHGERLEARHQGRALLPHVFAGLDRAHDRGIGRRAADAELFELLDQRRLGVAGGGLGVVPGGLDPDDLGVVALGQGRQELLGGLLLVVLVARLAVDLEEALVLDDGAGGGERGPTLGALDRGRGGAESEGDRLAGGVGHLRGDRALPDQLVDGEVLAAEFALHLFGSAEAVAGGTDRLVGLLGPLVAALVGAGRVGQEVLAVALGDLVASGGDRRVRQRGRVGSHVGDEATLVETLRHPHRLGRAEAQLSAGLLLVGRGDERRRRAPAIRLGLAALHRGRAALERRGEGTSAGLVEVDDVGLGQRAVLAEVSAGGDLVVVDLDQHRGERLLGGGSIERALEVPVVGRTERHALPFALHHDPGRHRLHTAGRQAPHDLLPQHGRDLVAVEPVEEAASLLGVDDLAIELGRVGDRPLDGLGGDLGEDDALHRDLRVEHLEQVPGDGLSLAVLIGREYEFARVLHQRLQLADVVLLVRADDVERLEVVVGVDAEAGPLLTLVGLGHIGGIARQVADVADRRLDHVVAAQVLRELAGLGRGLDDDERLCHERNLGSRSAVCEHRPQWKAGPERTGPVRRSSAPGSEHAQ